MNTYEVITLLFSFGLFLIALLTYIDKRKLKMPILSANGIGGAHKGKS